MNDLGGLVIGLTVANAFLFVGGAIFFLAGLKLYTEILKERAQNVRKTAALPAVKTCGLTPHE